MVFSMDTNEASIQRIADVAMVSRASARRALRGELVRGRDGERLAVAMRALGVPAVISEDLALRLRNMRIAPTGVHRGGTADVPHSTRMDHP